MRTVPGLGLSTSEPYPRGEFLTVPGGSLSSLGGTSVRSVMSGGHRTWSAAASVLLAADRLLTLGQGVRSRTTRAPAVEPSGAFIWRLL